jgi:hypothetical protein
LQKKSLGIGIEARFLKYQSLKTEVELPERVRSSRLMMNSTDFLSFLLIQFN